MAAEQNHVDGENIKDESGTRQPPNPAALFELEQALPWFESLSMRESQAARRAQQLLNQVRSWAETIEREFRKSVHVIESRRKELSQELQDKTREAEELKKVMAKMSADARARDQQIAELQDALEESRRAYKVLEEKSLAAIRQPEERLQAVFRSYQNELAKREAHLRRAYQASLAGAEQSQKKATESEVTRVRRHYEAQIERMWTDADVRNEGRTNG